MNFYYSCPQCFQDDGHPLKSFFDSYISDDDISEHICPRGHKFLIMSRNDKYRILFDIAVMQLQDGYYNNSILNSYTALEEFMKSFIKFSLYVSGSSVECILNVCKLIKRSENKKGAFILNFFQEFSEMIDTKKLEKFSSIRNSIIHDGEFVNHDKAYEYCEEMYVFISDILLRICSKYSEMDYINMDMAFQKYYLEKHQSVSNGSTYEIPSILCRFGIKNEISFEDKYENFKKTKLYSYNNPLKVIENNDK